MLWEFIELMFAEFSFEYNIIQNRLKYIEWFTDSSFEPVPVMLESNNNTNSSWHLLKGQMFQASCQPYSMDIWFLFLL